MRGGPAGLLLDEERDRLYVLARFTNELVVVDTDSRGVVQRHKMFNPEPASIVEGRPFLYDARRTSSHGDTACASCHVFGDFDGLSWDLGGPNDRDFENFGPFFARPEVTSFPLVSRFLALKGPMNTQSLRGLANHGSMHWRGDRRGGLTSTVHAQPDTGAFDENAAFNAFNAAFAGLNGRSQELSEEDMQKFTDFTLAITYPPNPIRHLDNELSPAPEARAKSLFWLRNQQRIDGARRMRGRPQHRRGDARLQLLESAGVRARARAASGLLPAGSEVHARRRRLPEHVQWLSQARPRRQRRVRREKPGLFGSTAFTRTTPFPTYSRFHSSANTLSKGRHVRFGADTPRNRSD